MNCPGCNGPKPETWSLCERCRCRENTATRRRVGLLKSNCFGDSVSSVPFSHEYRDILSPETRATLESMEAKQRERQTNG